jgi:hypothetical protein
MSEEKVLNTYEVEVYCQWETEEGSIEITWSVEVMADNPAVAEQMVWNKNYAVGNTKFTKADHGLRINSTELKNKRVDDSEALQPTFIQHWKEEDEEDDE